MPEVRFVIRWPDGASTTGYSPSRAIRDHVRSGEEYSLDEFVARCRSGLTAASDRVREMYGYPCTAAAGSLAAILQRADDFAADRAARVVIERFVPEGAASTPDARPAREDER